MSYRRIIIFAAIIAAAVAVPSCNRSKRAAEREVAEQPYAQPSQERPSTEKPSSEKPNTVRAEKLKVEKIEGFTRTGLLSGDLTVRICNDTRYALTVENGTATLCYSGSKVGALALREAVTIPKRATTSVRVPLEVHIGNPLAMYGAWNKVQRGELSDMTVSVEATLAAGIVKRNVVKNDIPLGVLLDMAGVTAEDIRNMVK